MPATSGASRPWSTNFGVRASPMADRKTALPAATAREHAAATRPAGDPSGAPGGAALFDRSDRVRILLEGRAPAQMLHGLVTGTIPGPPVPLPPGSEAGETSTAWATRASPSLVLTPKGRIVSDLRLLRLPGGEDAPFLLELPAAGAGPLTAHFGRYLPPRFARPADISADTRMLTLVGPGAADVLAAALAAAPGAGAPALRDLAAGLRDMAAGEARFSGTPSGSGAPFLVVLRTDAVGPPAWDLVGTPASIAPIEAHLLAAGVLPAGAPAWEILRIEQGTPETGHELDEGVIPPEAGLERSHIDHAKGCYTGQEVIVRIRDRGHVNRHLRGLLLGDGPAPDDGTPVWIEGRDREAGAVRSVTFSPRLGQWIALAYVRREAEPGTSVRLGTPDGLEAQVRALGEGDWARGSGPGPAPGSP
ncbi:MAG: aminomethyl transferase family protein [Gemmatimonadales bacterium]|nr:MAG: aminomethyl transferase family protein [Gemmatimonadales bacterium]